MKFFKAENVSSGESESDENFEDSGEDSQPSGSETDHSPINNKAKRKKKSKVNQIPTTNGENSRKLICLFLTVNTMHIMHQNEQINVKFV